MITVVTPVYNGERFIENCIKVVIEQNCPDVEHIIVDGGSTDGTVEIIKQYAEKYLHIRWISEKDRGQSDAMNKGIAMAKGDIISFLNVDDYYEPNVLNRVLQLFQELPVPSFLVGNCHVWDEQGNLCEISKPVNFNLINLLQGLNRNNYPTNPSAYFYHTSLHQDVGFYNVDEHYVMDLDFLLRVVQVAKVHYVDEAWGNWIKIEGTKTVTLWKSPKQGNQVLDRIIRHYRKDIPLLQRLQVTVKYEISSFWRRHFQWRFKHYFKKYLMMPKNIFVAIGSKLKTRLSS
jgi:glycosyltransferase involved in cell wall biosynthesis